MSKSTERAKPELTPEQRQVVEIFGEGVAVIAGAGSGKTFTLIEKVRRLLEKNPEARVAAVSFTEKSARDLRERLTKLSIERTGEGLKNHTVTTIHGLCSQILKEFPREAGYDGGEEQLTETEAEELWDRVMEALWFEDIPESVATACDELLERESREDLTQLLKRVRSIYGLGAVERMAEGSALRVLSEYVLTRYDRLKRREGVIDFQDLELGASLALSHASVREHYRRLFDLVLVDEFQDTNPLQASILERFVRPNFTNLCIVGDPKQSIYRFRDADVAVFERFCESMPHRVVLNRNYRSVPGVLDFCNETCSSLFEISQLRYDPLIPAKPAKPDEASVQKMTVVDAREFARKIRARIDSGWDPSGAVILLRKVRGKPERWLKALLEVDVPLAVESGGLLWSDPRARELISFLLWWERPTDELAGLAFLRSPWCGVRDETIERWKRDEGEKSLWRHFIESSEPLALAIRDLCAHEPIVRPGRLIEKLLSVRSFEESLAMIALKLWHRFEELSIKGLSARDAVQAVEKSFREGAREGTVPPPATLGQLRVMTVHGSKGLEFKEVILLDFPETPQRSNRPPLLYWDQAKGAYLVGRDADGERDKKSQAILEWKAHEELQSLRESKRVFYVALTRAEERLTLVLESAQDPEKVEKVLKKREKISDPRLIDDWRGWVESALVSRPEVDLSVGSRSTSDGISRQSQILDLDGLPPFSFAPMRPRHSISDFVKLDHCERLYRYSVIEGREEDPSLTIAAMGGAVADEKELAPEEPLTPTPKLSARELGSRVHAILEHADEGALDDLVAELGDSTFPESAIRKFLADERKRRAKNQETVDAWNELAFECPVGAQEIVLGAMDRLERDRLSGDYRVVDYKILRYRSTDAALTRRYGLQLEAYAWAVARIEPAARDRVSAELLVFDRSGYRTVKIPVGPDRFEELARAAARLLTQSDAPANTSHECRRCPFLGRCPEGLAHVRQELDSQKSEPEF